MNRRRGRPIPPVYTPETVDELCARLMGGETLDGICRDEHMPDRRTVLYWIRDKPEFYEKYLQARRVQMEHYVDEIITISDNTSADLIDSIDKFGNPVKVVNKAQVWRDRLKVDTRKWLAAHLAPNLYSDKTKIEISGAIGAYDISKLEDEELDQIERILSKVAIAALEGPVIEGSAVAGDDPEREPETGLRQDWWFD